MGKNPSTRLLISVFFYNFSGFSDCRHCEDFVDTYNYYYGLSYGVSTEYANMLKDYYFFNKLKTDKQNFEILLMKTNELLNFEKIRFTKMSNPLISHKNEE